MQKTARLLALAFFALLLLPTLACYNTYEEEIAHMGPQYYGKPAEAIKRNIEKEGLTRNNIAYEQKLEVITRELEHLRKEKASHTKKYAETESDYASVLCHVGKAKEALAILERLIQTYPNEYNIVANLGTTYELTGQNEKALQYIKKGLELNKESHRGSEWIHVKILEAKIAMQQNPNWLKENDILGKEARETAQSKEKAKIKRMIDDLGYQLFERTQFIQPKDAMVGDLIMFLGDLYKQMEEYTNAIDAYKLAGEYTVSKPDVLQASLAFVEENKSKDRLLLEEEDKKVVVTDVEPKEKPTRSPMTTILVLGALAVVVGSVWVMYFRGK